MLQVQTTGPRSTIKHNKTVSTIVLVVEHIKIISENENINLSCDFFDLII